MSFYPGDRYDAEPRSRSNFDTTSSRYDEDPRGPVRPYHDEEDEDEGNRFRDKHSDGKDSKEEREEAG